MSQDPRPHVVIIGGGYGGASTAVQLARRSPQPLRISVVEPRAELGRGLAYSAQDPDHRLNAPAVRHFLDPQDSLAFAQWHQDQQAVLDDPQAVWEDGRCYPRRRDFGRFIAQTLAAWAPDVPPGAAAGGRAGSGTDPAETPGAVRTTIEHVRETAQAVRATTSGHQQVVLAGAGETALAPADLVVLSTGHPVPRLPGFVDAALHERAGVIGNPMDIARIQREVQPQDRVCILGSGLTALDVLTTLVRGGHRGPITVVSRRGLRPRPQVPGDASLALPTVARLSDPPPDFVQALGPSPTVRGLTRALRQRVAADAAAGVPWQVPFDALRDGVWAFWPHVAEAEKQRYARHLRIWYDVHRFRTPPQNEACVAPAEASGQLRYLAARVVGVTGGGAGPIRVDWQPRGSGTLGHGEFDALINCTGVDGGGHRTDNPVLLDLLSQGLLQPGPAGLGYRVDEQLRVLDHQGIAHDRLRLIGPPTVGALGDMIGAAFIAVQVARALPSWLDALAVARAPVASL